MNPLVRLLFNQKHLDQRVLFINLKQSIMMNIQMHFYTLLVGAILFFSACSDDEIVDPYLRTDLPGEIINLVSDAVEAYDVKVMTNQTDWNINPMQKVEWCSCVRISDGDNSILRFSIQENEGTKKREVEYLLTASACEPIKIKFIQLGTEHAIEFNQFSPKNVSCEQEEFDLIVTSNVSYISTVEASDGEGNPWIEISEQVNTRSFSDKVYKVKVLKNIDYQDRVGLIKFIPSVEDTNLTEPKVFTVKQEKAALDNLEDIKLKVVTADRIEGNCYDTKNGDVDKTIDGDYTTVYASRRISQDLEGNRNNPIRIEYTLEKPSTVDYVRLVQSMKDNPDELLATGSISFLKEGESEWSEEQNFVAQQIAGANIDVSLHALKVSKIRVRLDRMSPGLKNFNVKFAEFECYQSSDDVSDILDSRKFFIDDIYSELKPGVTSDDIKSIKHSVIRLLAQELQAGTYDKRFRVATYQSCKNPRLVGNELTIGQRSIYDNPTGIYFEKADPVLAFVSFKGVSKTPISLAFADYRDGGARGKVVTLKEGLNIIDPPYSGNGYVQYWTNNETKDVDVDIHFCFGKQIGYWDMRRGHTDDDWPEILEIAKKCANDVPDVMTDILGTYIQLHNTVNAFVTYASNGVKDIVEAFDMMLYYEYEMMGLVKHDALPANRFLGVRSWSGSPCWNGVAAMYPNDEKGMLVRSEFLKPGFWMYGHEFGHGNQVNILKNKGWNETTNNLLNAYAQYMMKDYPESSGYLGMDDDPRARPGKTRKLVLNRYNGYLNEALVENKLYFAQTGNPIKKDPETGEEYYEGQTYTMMPLWQLVMYFNVLGENPDFWPDVHWKAIHYDKVNDIGKKYIVFMKLCIEAANLDLCEFFEVMGLLKIHTNFKVKDYGIGTINITQSMIDEVKQFASGKPKPTAYIQYIAYSNVEAFRNKLDVVGTYNEGFTMPDDGSDYIIIDSNQWKNAIAFETYVGNKLTDINVAGTGDKTYKTTWVDYPTGATRVEAVGWDGKRTLVLGKR